MLVARLPFSAATEALGQSDIATDVHNLGRIGAQIAVEATKRRVFHGHGIWGSTILNPALERLENRSRLATEATRAVTQTRRLKEAPEILNVGEKSQRLVVEVFGALGGDAGIGLFGKCAMS